MGKVDLSIVILGYRGTTALAELYGSLRKALSLVPEAEIEVITVVNGAAPALASVVEQHALLPSWHFIHLQKATSPPQARNHAIARATGEWIVFFDDDILIPEHYFSTLIAAASRHSEAAVIGGPNLNPPGASAFEAATGNILGSPLVTGPFAARYAVRGGPRLTRGDCRFILCNLAVRGRSAKPFPVDMPFGEENAMLFELREEGHPFLFLPELYVYHRRRPTALEFSRQMVKYGKGRGLLIKKYGLARSSNLWLGLAFAATAAALAAQPILFITLYTIAVLSAAGYAAASAEKSLKVFPHAVSAILICHFYYPAGCLLGWLGREKEEVVPLGLPRWQDLDEVKPKQAERSPYILGKELY